MNNFNLNSNYKFLVEGVYIKPSRFFQIFSDFYVPKVSKMVIIHSMILLSIKYVLIFANLFYCVWRNSSIFQACHKMRNRMALGLQMTPIHPKGKNMLNSSSCPPCLLLKRQAFCLALQKIPIVFMVKFPLV